jgi:ketosteroid isomerase-like protein
MKSAIEQTLLSTYAARVRGDLDATMAAFADDTIYQLNGRGTGAPNFAGPVHGKAALRSVMAELIRDYRFSDWRAISLLVDGDKALLHWRALVTVTANGRANEFDVFDLVTFRDGKFATFHQSTDTAMIQAMMADGSD